MKNDSQITVLDHPGVRHHLGILRSKASELSTFRSAAASVTRYLMAEIVKTSEEKNVEIETPMERTVGQVMEESFVLIPILRAGLGMLDVALDFLPEAKVGFIGMERDETSASAKSYYAKFPDLRGRTAILLDPMLATGGSAIQAVKVLLANGPKRVILASIIAAPEGITAFREACPEVGLIIACVDRELDASKYIRPGLGDFGDRLYGTTPH